MSGAPKRLAAVPGVERRAGERPARKYRAHTRSDLDRLTEGRLHEERRLEMKAVAAVFPFRTNDYVVDELIRWDDVPDDPIFQLTFPQPEMLETPDRARMLELVRAGASDVQIGAAAREIQLRMNPHPAGQMELNVPRFDGRALAGMQHKYRETVLFFPSQGQTCHAYCTYCFRWAQFVGLDEMRFASREAEQLARYLARHREVSSVLFTGGDPLIMTAAKLRAYVEPLLSPELEHLISIRIGSKAPAYWPYRFISDRDSDELLALFRSVRAAGKHLALMAHYSHPRELETPAAQLALQRIIDTGAVVRCQAPCIRHVNDSADAWAELWRLQVQLGAVPYYMFVERDTGPKRYFELPLARVLEIFRGALQQVSGLARTVRGPSMSATPGKVVIRGVSEIRGERVFVLEFLQGRDPDWTGRPFFARYDPQAMWLDDLRPALGEGEFFFEAAMRRMRNDAHALHRPLHRRQPVIFGRVEWE
jgi:L-lysine 2,3-aminomutase